MQVYGIENLVMLLGELVQAALEEGAKVLHLVEHDVYESLVLVIVVVDISRLEDVITSTES